MPMSCLDIPDAYLRVWYLSEQAPRPGIYKVIADIAPRPDKREILRTGNCVEQFPPARFYITCASGAPVPGQDCYSLLDEL